MTHFKLITVGLAVLAMTVACKTTGGPERSEHDVIVDAVEQEAEEHSQNEVRVVTDLDPSNISAEYTCEEEEYSWKNNIQFETQPFYVTTETRDETVNVDDNKLFYKTREVYKEDHEELILQRELQHFIRNETYDDRFPAVRCNVEIRHGFDVTFHDEGVQWSKTGYLNEEFDIQCDTNKHLRKRNGVYQWDCRYDEVSEHDIPQQIMNDYGDEIEETWRHRGNSDE